MKPLILALALLVACKSDKQEAAEQVQEQAEKAVDESRAAAAKEKAAIDDARAALDQAKATEERLSRIERDLDALDANMSRVIQALTGAKNDQEREAARLELESLKRQQADLRARIAAEKAAATSAGAGSSR